MDVSTVSFRDPFQLFATENIEPDNWRFATLSESVKIKHRRVMQQKHLPARPRPRNGARKNKFHEEER